MELLVLEFMHRFMRKVNETHAREVSVSEEDRDALGQVRCTFWRERHGNVR
jgi:hypothetical protein